ncbi:MAG TPA: hypothetical protein EYG79_07945 [Rhodobacteraceae bacterium]|nr:hypothetical protein [Paracoccaceae bacterium]
MNIWICGNSHLAALRRGYVNIEPPKPLLKFFPLGSGSCVWEDFSAANSEGVYLTAEEFAERFAKATNLDYFDPEDVWGICIGGHSPRLYAGANWKSSRPSHLQTGQKRPISLGLLDALIEYDHKYIFRFFKRLKAAKIKFFVIATPPPPENYHDGRRLDEVETMGFIEQRARDRFKRLIEKEEIDYVDLPENITDENGFIKKEYKLQFMHNGRHDGHHANESFGQLMVENITDFLHDKNHIE